MSRRQIRVRPVRREQIDLRRLGAAIAALAAENTRREDVAKAQGTSANTPRRAA